jgi:general secretion pathway protein A
MDAKLLALFSLRYNPFSPDVPTDALLSTPKLENFCWRIENAHLKEGGFALVTGDPGTGKSVALRLLSHRLGRLRDVVVGTIAHPQSSLGDFYREMGDVFGVALQPHNRWGGFKALRQRWQTYIESTLTRPVLLIDEAQEMSTAVLSELRLLSSMHFDSKILLSVVLAGDGRLTERFRQDELLPLGSRIRTRLTLDYATPEELRTGLKHLLTCAGNAQLMAPELAATLADHAAGNYRTLMTLAGELLATAAQRELTHLDEKLYFEVFAPPQSPRASRPAAAARRA